MIFVFLASKPKVEKGHGLRKGSRTLTLKIHQDTSPPPHAHPYPTREPNLRKPFPSTHYHQRGWKSDQEGEPEPAQVNHFLGATVEPPSSQETAEPKTLYPQPAAPQGDLPAPSPPLHTLVSGTPKPPQGSSSESGSYVKMTCPKPRPWLRPLQGELCFLLTVIFTHPYDCSQTIKMLRKNPIISSVLLCSRVCPGNVF